MRIIKIKNCINCPHIIEGEIIGYFCGKTNQKVQFENYVPVWCPLEKYVEKRLKGEK